MQKEPIPDQTSDTPADDQFVDINGAVEILKAMGFHDKTVRKVRRAADEGRYPFFKDGSKRWIQVRVLKDTALRRQIDAIKGQSN